MQNNRNENECINTPYELTKFINRKLLSMQYYYSIDYGQIRIYFIDPNKPGTNLKYCLRFYADLEAEVEPPKLIFNDDECIEIYLSFETCSDIDQLLGIIADNEQIRKSKLHYCYLYF